MRKLKMYSAIRGSYQTRFEYTMGGCVAANAFGGGNVGLRTKTASTHRGGRPLFQHVNRATSYSPTHLRVQYHRG